MNRRNIPLGGLRAFEAAARRLSFSAAAKELYVTHGAISQQIKGLEDTLGLRLFERHNRGVRLTPAGQTLLPVLSVSFDRIATNLEGLLAAPGKGSLRVTTTPYFAARWLVSQLSAWRQLDSSASVHLVPSLEFLDFAEGGIDVGIRCGRPPWPGLQAEFLMPIHLSPLCSAGLAERAAGLRKPQDLLGYTLIHADVTGHPLGEEWRAWLAAAGVGDTLATEGLSFQDPNLALQAAADGIGIAMGYLEFVQAEVEAGRLVQPFPLAVRHPFSYYLVYPQARAQEPTIKEFRQWILAQARADSRVAAGAKP